MGVALGSFILSSVGSFSFGNFHYFKFRGFHYSETLMFGTFLSYRVRLCLQPFYPHDLLLLLLFPRKLNLFLSI